MPLFYFRIFLLSILLLFLLPNGRELSAQEYKFRHYTLENGLSQVSVNDIIEDKTGFLWIGTQSGLNRFDGNFFKIFEYDPTDSLSISGNFINCVLEDSHGRIWVGTEANGLCYYSHESENFKRIKTGVQDLTVYAMTEDKQGFLWLALGSNGIGRVNLLTGEAEIFFPNNDNSLNITTAYISDNILWCGTKKGEIFKALPAKTIAEMSFSLWNREPNKNQIYTISSNNNDFIWVGTSSGALKYNTNTKESTPVNLSDNKKETIANPKIVYDFEWDSENKLWIATGAGLFFLTPDIQSPGSYRPHKHFELNELNTSSLSNNTVYSVYSSRDNSIWIGTGKYLNLLYNNSYFNTLRSIPGSNQSLNSNVIFSILKDNKDYWFGTSGGGLNLMRNDNFYYFTREDNKLASNVVFSLMKDSLQNLWIGTKEGISILESKHTSPENYSFLNIFHSSKNSGSLSNNFIRQVYRDSHGNIWVCTYWGGLNRFTGNLKEGDFSFKHYRNTGLEPNQISSDRVYCIRQDKHGNYWIGTDKGLNKLIVNNNFEDERFYSWHNEPGNDNSLSNNIVYDIIEDSDGLIWIGTRDGLNIFNPQTQTFTIFNEQSGLPNKVIYSVVEDLDGKIWVSTNDGIACFDKATKLFTNYSDDDGLQSPEFNLSAKFIDKSGRIYFGGISGLNSFYPNKLRTIDKETPIILSAVTYGNASDKVNKTTAEYLKSGILLKHDQFPFYLGFSNIDLRPFKNIEFAFRLNPVDKSWNSLGQKKEIQFVKLSPGEYTLQIQGKSRGKLWQTKPFEIKILITPPWWRTWLAYMIYVLLFFSSVYLIYRFQLKQIVAKKETKRLHELDNLRNKLYADITHEFRTPLTVILGIADKLKSTDLLKKESLIHDLEMIERNSDNLLNLVNQMLDLARLDQMSLTLKSIQGDVIPYLRYVFECFRSFAEIKKINYILYTEIEELIMDFDPDQLYKIVSNLIANAIKYSEDSGEVILHVKHDDKINQLVLKVSNPGSDIPADAIKHIFKRFYRVHNSERYGEGAGIGLALTKELTELMGGKITVNSNKASGTIFIVNLPVKNQAVHATEMLHPRIHIPFNQKSTGSDIKGISTKSHPDALSVLLIEDNADVRLYLESCLLDKYTILKAHDGQSGIDKAFLTMPDIIITDIMMPGKNGFEVCSELKNDFRTSHIPIIILTAKVAESDKLSGFTRGADAYLEKPFNKAELFIRIEQLLTNKNRIIEKYRNFNEPASKPESQEEIFLTKIINKIFDALESPNFKSSDLAFAMNLSEAQLYRKIKALTGKSTAVYIRFIRLKEAHKMLQNIGQNVSEVAYACGFNDPAWFSRAFKEEFGYSPTTVRDNNSE